MAEEYMSFDEVLSALQIDEDELKKMVSAGELRGFRDGASMKFKKADVFKLKKGRETEPTIILSDSDAEITLPEESADDADLLVQEPGGKGEDRDTVLNIDVFETADKKGKTDSDVGTVNIDDLGEETAAKGGDESGAATLIDVGGPTEMTTESFDLIEEAPPQAEDFEVVDTTITGSGRISRSARLRAMQIKKKKGHPIMTSMLCLTMALMLIPFAFLYNQVRGVEPNYLVSLGGTFRGFIDWLTSIFAG
jgi:hypothetical protein